MYAFVVTNLNFLKKRIGTRTNCCQYIVFGFFKGIIETYFSFPLQGTNQRGKVGRLMDSVNIIFQDLYFGCFFLVHLVSEVYNEEQWDKSDQDKLSCQWQFSEDSVHVVD